MKLPILFLAVVCAAPAFANTLVAPNEPVTHAHVTKELRECTMPAMRAYFAKHEPGFQVTEDFKVTGAKPIEMFTFLIRPFYPRGCAGYSWAHVAYSFTDSGNEMAAFRYERCRPNELTTRCLAYVSIFYKSRVNGMLPIGRQRDL